MNLGIVRTTLGRILTLEGALLALPLLISIFYQESPQIALAYLAGGIITFGTGLLLTRKKPDSGKIYAQEGMVITALSWILLSAFGALPLVFSGEFPTYIDAFFEMSSGFTTSGASVAADVEILSQATLFWRSFTLFLGGMGVLVFALALQPKLQAESVHMMKAEMPGPTFSKVTARLSSTARILYVIYITMTVILFLILVLLRMPPFEALLHAFGTAATGGFTSKNASIGHYNSPAIEYVITVGMFLFGVNFNLFYFMLLRRFKEVFKSEELRWYAGIIAVAVFLIMLNTRPWYASEGLGLETQFRNVLFQVTSMITTTGFSTYNLYQWPLFSQGVIMTVMFIGANAGSASGALKISRVVMAVKIAFIELRQVRQPRRVMQIRFEGRPIGSQAARSILSYLVMFALIFVAGVLLLMLDLGDFKSSFIGVLTTLNNVGLSLEETVPGQRFETLAPLSKVMLSFLMITGRLELWPVLLLFSRETWQRTT